MSSILSQVSDLRERAALAVTYLRDIYVFALAWQTPVFAEVREERQRAGFTEMIQRPAGHEHLPPPISKATEMFKYECLKLDVPLSDAVLRERIVARVQPDCPLPVEDRERLMTLCDELAPIEARLWAEFDKPAPELSKPAESLPAKQLETKAATDLSLDARALALFLDDTRRRKKDIARLLGLKNTQSLAPARCRRLDAAMRAHRAPDPEPVRGTKDRDGNLEAWDKTG